MEFFNFPHNPRGSIAANIAAHVNGLHNFNNHRSHNRSHHNIFRGFICFPLNRDHGYHRTETNCICNTVVLDDL